jgi:asparagine synthase (glutamine-hydrolysing)
MPIDAFVLKSMTNAVAHRGPDDSGMWIEGSTGLGHRAFHTTLEGLGEHQPLSDETGKVHLVLDGRIDNHDDLSEILAAKGMRLRDDSDAELVLKSYLHWTENAPIHMLGDFAFAVWDARYNMLFCARDVFGIRPLTYFCGANFVLIASELHQLFCDPRVKRVVNEGMVAEYLAFQITHCEETLWDGILRLPAAHLMWVKAGKVTKRRYWDFDLDRKISCSTEEEYAREFLEVFREAVRCRLRSRGRIGSYLSGGLDSSTVSVIANELRREQGCSEPMDTFSLLFPSASCDESSYIQEVVKHAGLRSHLFVADPPCLDYYRQQVILYQDFPGWPNGGAMLAPLQNGLRSTGTRVVLTGWGGNECLEGSSTATMTQLAREAKLLELIRTAKAEAADSDVAWLRMTWDYGIRPNIPAAWKVPLRRIRRSPLHWLSPELVQRTNLLDRIQPVPLNGATRVQEAIYAYFYSGINAHFHENWDRNAALVGVEERHPFLDRRVAEFAFALPEEQRSHRGRNKIVLRKAMKGRLPRSVEERRLQADFTPVVTAAIRVAWKQQPFPSVAMLSRGCTVANEMAASLDRALGGNLKDLWRVWAATGIDIWYSNSLRTSSQDAVWVGDRLSVMEGQSDGGSGD